MSTWAAIRPCGCAVAAISDATFGSYNKQILAKFAALMLSIDGTTVTILAEPPMIYTKPCLHEARQLELISADQGVTYNGVTWYRDGKRVDWDEERQLQEASKYLPGVEDAAKARHAERYPVNTARAAKHAKPADNGHGNDPEIEARARAEQTALADFEAAEAQALQAAAAYMEAAT
jgi:hypothetical protein